MTTYFSTENRIGVPGSGVVSSSSTPAVQPGTIVRMKNSRYGDIEAIYLSCLSGQKAGNLVTFVLESSALGTPSRSVVALTTSTKNQAVPCAVALAANTTGANNYGWFAIEGTVPVLKTAVKVSPNAKVFLGTTTGRIGPSSGSGKQVLNTKTMNTATVASATSTVYVYINRPFLQGQVT